MKRSKRRVARVHVRVTPGAREDAVLGWEHDILRVRVKARAEGGRANDAVCRLLAESLGVRASAIAIVHGATSRHKSLRIEGLTNTDLRRLIGSQARTEGEHSSGIIELED